MPETPDAYVIHKMRHNIKQLEGLGLRVEIGSDHFTIKRRSASKRDVWMIWTQHYTLREFVACTHVLTYIADHPELARYLMETKDGQAPREPDC